METITHYKEIVKLALSEIARLIPSDDKVELETIFDDQRGHYLLFTVGWTNNKREYSPILHIDVKPNGKVYLQHDGTDLEFALRLFEKGIPKSDMVVAYRSPHQRQFLTDFALA
jgi:XisI protein